MYNTLNIHALLKTQITLEHNKSKQTTVPTFAVVETHVKHMLVREVCGVVTGFAAPFLYHGLCVRQVPVPEYLEERGG